MYGINKSTPCFVDQYLAVYSLSIHWSLCLVVDVLFCLLLRTLMSCSEVLFLDPVLVSDIDSIVFLHAGNNDVHIQNAAWYDSAIVRVPCPNVCTQACHFSQGTIII